MSGPVGRAKLARATQGSRLARTQLLDKYMPALKGRCPFHFAVEGRLVDDEWPYCPHMVAFSRGFDAFKRTFHFEKFAYCYVCGMPQDRDRNGEGPGCHAGHTFEKKKACVFGSFIFRVSYCLWQLPALRSEMVASIGIGQPITTQQEFTDWAVIEDDDEGKYHNCLEAFLWFCQRKAAEDPGFFL